MSDGMMEMYQNNALIKVMASAYKKCQRTEIFDDLINSLAEGIMFDSDAYTLIKEYPSGRCEQGILVDEEGFKWVPVFTSLNEAVKAGMDDNAEVFSIGAIIDTAYDFDEFDGVIINPCSDDVCLNKDDLDQLMDLLMNGGAAA